MSTIATKQVIVMRTDLNMRKGKMAAQASHASLGVFFARKTKTGPGSWAITFPPEQDAVLSDWMDGIFTKICVGVDGEAAVRQIHEAALAAGIPTSLIVDAGKTEFGGVPTVTCCAVGPWHADAINALTGHLKLL